MKNLRAGCFVIFSNNKLTLHQALYVNTQKSDIPSQTLHRVGVFL